MSRDFQRLAREHGGRIYTFALHALRSREDAEDVTQEVLVRLWRHGHNVDPAHLSAWVMRVARNLVIDTSRRRRMRTSRVADGTDVETVAGAVAEVSPSRDGAERGELRAVLEAAVSALDEPYRSIVIMRDVQDRSYNEIAEAMEMPLGTVKVYLHRARRRLRERLRGEMGNALR